MEKNNFQFPLPIISLNEIFHILSKNALLENKINEINPKLNVYFHSRDIENHLKNSTNSPEFVYIARKGQKFDGHTLAEKVINSGNFFIGEIEPIKNIYQDKANDILKNNFFICVKNSENALHYVLEEAFKINSKNFFTIAVTGTNGKTSVTQITANLLHELCHENILKIGTLGVQAGDVTLPVSHVTTPDYPSFLNILAAAQNNNIKKIVLEYTSHGLKEKRLGNWLADIAIFTNLTQDHLDYHSTMEDYRESKQKLFNTYLSDSGTAVINLSDYSESKNFIDAAINKNRDLIVVGNKDTHQIINHNYKDKFKNINYIHIEKSNSGLNGISGVLVVKNNELNVIVEQEFQCPLIGEFQFENILCAAGVGVALNFSLNKICQAFLSIKNIPGRLEKVQSKSLTKAKTPTILVDYAHTPDALEKSILTCKKALSTGGKLITVFGCGGDRDATKRPLMGKIAFSYSDLVIVTSDNPRTEDPNKIINDIFAETNENEKWMREWDRKKAIEKAILMAEKKDLILIAGKGHEDYQIIGTTKYPFSDADVVKSILENQ